MGPKRLQMFEEGKLNFQTAVDPTGRPLTLGELKEKYECHVDPKRFKEWHGPMEEEYGRLMAIHGDIDKVRRAMPDSAFEVKNLPQVIKDALGTSAGSLLFSADSLAKQLYKHPGMDADIYIKLINKIKSCTEFYANGDYRIALVVEAGSPYKIILKTSKDYSEAYAISMFKLRNNQLEQIRKTEPIKPKGPR
jgi:hypothetical protein